MDWCVVQSQRTLRRQVWRDELLYKWTPNFYIIFVGPPGIVTKSTTLNIGYSLLRRVPGIHFGPDSMTWHGLAKKFEAAFEYKVYKLTVMTKNSPCPLSPVPSASLELSSVLTTKDLYLFLQTFGMVKNGPSTILQKTAAKSLSKTPGLTLLEPPLPCGCKITFRLLFFPRELEVEWYSCTEKQSVILRLTPLRIVQPSDYADTATKLTEDLIHISKLCGPYELTPEAYVWGEAWYKNPKTSQILASTRYSGYIARKQTHLHKLAMILAASQRDDLLITREDLIEADQILQTTEVSMVKVFESVGVVDEAKHLAEVVAFVRAYKLIIPRDLYYQNCHNIMMEKDFKAAIRHAMDGGLLEVVQQNGVAGLAPKTRTTH